jgi:hypothetical protein
VATKIKTFDFDQPSTLTTTDKATYPWDLWFDGDLWELTWGEDFETHPLMMERIVRTRATGRGAKVRMRHVSMNGDPWGKIVLQRTDLVGPEEAKRAERKAKSAATRAANKSNGKQQTNEQQTNGKKVMAAKKVAPKPPTKRITKRQLVTAS